MENQSQERTMKSRSLFETLKKQAEEDYTEKFTASAEEGALKIWMKKLNRVCLCKIDEVKTFSCQVYMFVFLLFYTSKSKNQQYFRKKKYYKVSLN